jgi:hypothetical protein
MQTLRNSAAMALMLVGALAGCNADPVSPSDSVAGTYNLATIGGEVPPGVYLQTEDQTVLLTGGRLVLGSDGQFLLRSEYTIQHSGGSVDDVEVLVGSWTVSGSQLSFTESDSGAEWTATVQGNTVTRVTPSATIEYVR